MTRAATGADGPGTTETSKPASSTLRTNRSPGSAIPGVPASVDDRHGCPLGQPSDDLAGSRLLGVLIEPQQARSGDSGVAQESSRATGVLACNQVSGGQDLDRPLGEVPEVSYRGCNEDEQPGPGRRAHSRTVNSSPTLRPPPLEGTGLGLEYGARAPYVTSYALAVHGRRVNHPHLGVEVRHVYREPHADRVHQPGRLQEDRSIDAVAPQQAPTTL